MPLVRRLADHYLAAHPDRAAAALEPLTAAEIAQALSRGSAAHAASLLRRLSPHIAAEGLRALAPERGAELLAALEVNAGARLLRRVGEPLRSAITAALESRRARTLRTLLDFPEDSAGAWMDPEVLALPQDLSAREALARVRGAASFARYNLYVVDREQRLVGVLNLRELLLARGRELLSNCMVQDPDRLVASADRTAILAHPGWRRVTSLPVVDAEGAYLGAIRYRTLRELEAQLVPTRRDEDTSSALSQLLSTGARALVETLTGPGTQGGTRGA